MNGARLLIGHDRHGKAHYMSADDLVHMGLFGATRLGKTFEMLSLVRQFWRLSLAGHCNATITIDPHGDLYEDLLGSAWVMGMKDRIVLFDPGPTWLPTLNPLRSHYGDVDVASLTLRAVQKACGDDEPDQMPRLQRHLRSVLRVLTGANLTLLDAYDFLASPEVRMRLVEEVEEPRLRAFWEQFAQLPDRIQAERVESTENRIDRLVGSSAVMQRILGAAESSIDIARVMDEGKHLIVNLGHANLTHEQRKLLGSLLIETIFETAMRRPRNRRSPCYVFLDEAADFLTGDEDLPRALAQTGKFRVHFILAVQMLAQLAEEHPILKSAVLTNCTTRIAFGGSREDADVVAPELFSGRFHQDEIKHELHRTIHRYREEERTVSSEVVAEGAMEGSSWMAGGGHMGGAGHGTSMQFDPTTGLMSTTASDSGFDSFSDYSASGSSQSSFRSVMRGSTRVPFLKPVEDQELAGVQFRSPEEIRERYTANLKRQPPRWFHFQCGHHREAVQLRSPFVRLYDVPAGLIDRFRLEIFERTGCMVQAGPLAEQIEARRCELTLPPRREPTRVSVKRPPARESSEAVPARKPTRVSSVRRTRSRAMEVESNV